VIRPGLPTNHPLAGQQPIELLLDQRRGTTWSVADCPEAHPTHPVREGRAEYDVPRLGTHSLCHDVDEHETRKRAVWYPQTLEALLTVNPFDHWLRIDHERVLPVLPDDGCVFIHGAAYRQ
jgi:hypothetical protein